jgi:hypothetical protein
MAVTQILASLKGRHYRGQPNHSKREKPKEALTFGKLSLPSILGNYY